MENVKCLIIGSGPSGYTAAIYTSRANLSPVLYEGIEPGGQLTTTTEIFPGFTEGIDGPKLMDNMRRQALRFGADIRPGVITSVDLSSRPFHVIVNGEKEIQAEALIISTGAAAKYLGLPSEEKFKGMGVLRHLRRILLPQEGRSGRRRRRYGMRGGHLPGFDLPPGISDRPQALPAGFESHAGAGNEHPEHQSPLRAQHGRSIGR